MIPTVFRFFSLLFFFLLAATGVPGTVYWARAAHPVNLLRFQIIHTSGFPTARGHACRVLLVPHVAPYNSSRKEKRRTVLPHRTASGPTGSSASRESIYCRKYAPSHVHSFLGTGHHIPVPGCHGGAPGFSFDSHTHVHTCTLRNPSTGMATQDNMWDAPVLQPQPLRLDANHADSEGDDRVRTIPQTCTCALRS